MAIGEDGQMTFRVRCCELWFCACVVECLSACVETKAESFCLSATQTFGSRVALARVVMSYRVVRVVVGRCISYVHTQGIALVLELVLVFPIATIALGVMRLELARTTTVLALLDGATLGVDVMQFSVWTPCQLERRP